MSEDIGFSSAEMVENFVNFRDMAQGSGPEVLDCKGLQISGNAESNLRGTVREDRSFDPRTCLACNYISIQVYS